MPEKSLLWNVRPVNHIVDFADKLDIVMNQGRRINSKPVWCRPKIFSSIRSVWCRKKLNGELEISQYFVSLKANRNRVLHIPLNAGADYRSVLLTLHLICSLFIVMPAGLPVDQFEWQFADPSSSIARAKYRPGDVYAYSCSF